MSKIALLLGLVVCSACRKDEEVLKTDVGTALVKNLVAIPLGEKISPDEFQTEFEKLIAKWQEVYPEVDWGWVDTFLAAKPVALVFVPDAIDCVHEGSGPGLQICSGLFRTANMYIMISKRNGEPLCGTAMTHELAHLLSYILLSDSDHDHQNTKVWTDIVQALHDDC